MFAISKFPLKNLSRTIKKENFNFLKNKTNKNFTIYNKYVNNSNTNLEKGLNETLNQNLNQNEQKIILDPNTKISVQYSKTTSDLVDEINGPHIQHKNFDKLYTFFNP